MRLACKRSCLSVLQLIIFQNFSGESAQAELLLYKPSDTTSKGISLQRINQINYMRFEITKIIKKTEKNVYYFQLYD